MRVLFIIKVISAFFLVITCTQINAQFGKPQFEHISIEGVLLSVAQQGSEDRYNVDCMLQDSKGYLWFGTWDGLNKYDGYNFTTYKHTPQDTNTLIQNTIFTIWEDKYKIIWLGTAEGGISKFDRYTGNFTQYSADFSITPYAPSLRAVSAINEDETGAMWVGNFLGELRRFNKHTGKFYPQNFNLGRESALNTKYRKENIYSRGHDAINCIFKDHTGALWIGNSVGLHKLVLTKNELNKNYDISFTHYIHDSLNANSISHSAVTCIFEDHTQTLWIGTDGGGLNRFDERTNTFIHYQYIAGNNNSISNNAIARGDIAEDANGNLWIGTFYGLNKLDASRKTFTRYYNDPLDPLSLSNNFIESLLIDKSGILWVGSHWKGVDKYDPQQKPFKLYSNSEGSNSLSNNLVTSITGDDKGTIWIATAGGGLNALNKQTDRFTIYKHDEKNPSGIDDDIVNAVIKDKKGNLWVRCQDMLSEYDPVKNNFIHYSRDTPVFNALVKEHLTAVYFDNNNNLWMGTHNGIRRLNLATGAVNFYSHNPQDTTSLSDNAVYTFYEDKSGYMWIGHGSVGLSRLDVRTGKFKHYMPYAKDTSALSTCIVNCIYQDSKNNLWFGTLGGGLCRFNEQQQNFTTYTDKERLADNTIISILEDNDGNLWLGTGKGLSRYTPATHTFINYDFNDGLQGNIFSEACYKDENGLLYFGGLHGFSVFNPRQLKPNRYIPPIVFTQFKLFDKLVSGKNEATEIILKSDENFFSFQFSALNYSNPEKNQYAYQLKGIDKNWVYSGTRREASYTDIAPGDYTFRVKASNNDNVWNEDGISVRIIIQPPWWRTYWMYGLYLVCLAAIIMLLFRMQRHRLTKRQYERIREVQLADIKRELELEKSEQERKEAEFKKRLVELTQTALRSQINPHFIFNCLNSIKLYAEQNKVNAASEYLTKFSKLIRQVLENSRSEKITLTEEFEVLRLSIEMEVMRFKEKLQYSILIDGNVEADFIEIPPLLLQPYVENAIWHGLMPKEEGGMVEIKAVMKSETTLLITIRDNGIGRSKAAEEKNKSGTGHKSFGMKITSERMELMNQMYNTISRINIDDLKDDAGVATGTLVTLQIEV